MEHFIDQLHLGRNYCNECESFDDECDCEPNVNERYRLELRREFETNNQGNVDCEHSHALYELSLGKFYGIRHSYCPFCGKELWNIASKTKNVAM